MMKYVAEHGEERTAKMKATKLERHGSEGFNNHKKISETKAKIYGDPDFNNRPKAMGTSVDRYGVPHALQREDFKEKQRATNRERYGVDYIYQNNEIMAEMLRSIKERNGGLHTTQRPEIKERVTQTWQEKIHLSKQYELYASLEENGLKLLGDFKGINHPNYLREENGRLFDYDFECLVCQNKFSRTFANKEIPICRVCHPSQTRPSTQDLIRNLLTERGISFAENNRHFLGNRKEVDFLVPSHKLCIEVNGNFFHSELFGGRDDRYHIDKTLAAREKGARLIHIFEDEIKNKPDIVLHQIALALNDAALKSADLELCTVGILSDEQAKTQFLETNHLEGAVPFTHDVGLWHEGELIALMSFNPTDEPNRYELVRFCSKLGYNASNHFSALFSFFVARTSPTSISATASIRWQGYDPDSTIYSKNSFLFQERTAPSFWYFKKSGYMKRIAPSEFPKPTLINEAITLGLTDTPADLSLLDEWELAQALGMDRIWDCGHLKFLWTNPSLL